jgi:hypothetical protein
MVNDKWFMIMVNIPSLTGMSKYLILLYFLFSPFTVYGQDPPHAVIVRPLNGTVFNTDQVRVDYLVYGTEPKSVKIFVDDKPVQLLTGVKIGDNSVMVDVPAHDCKISIIAQNEYGTGAPAVVNLTRSDHIFKPSLYVLAIGVSNYASPDLRLQFASKDAADFSRAMLLQEGLLYERVHLKLLTDLQASSDNIRDGLYWLQTETTSHDVAMLYMAGHGIVNNVGGFYFMPTNADINRINSSCVGYTEIKETVSAISGKILVFMDACHSGSVFGNNQRRAAVFDDVVNELASAENGAVVFTSSTGRQFSLENSEWNNGAFTKALVEGLEGKADMFNRKTVTVKSLDLYVANRVKELTAGQQAPTTIIPNSVPDFPVAVKLDYTDMPREKTVVTETERSSEEKNYMSNEKEETAQVKIGQMPYYCSVGAGASTFGNYLRARSIVRNKVLLADVNFAYFFTPAFGVGLKASCEMSDVKISSPSYHFSYGDYLLFYGPALYGRFGNDRLAFSASVGTGGITWRLTDICEHEVPRDKAVETHTIAGVCFAAGGSCMFGARTGIALNVQTCVGLGSLKDNDGFKRNPAGTGITLMLFGRF